MTATEDTDTHTPPSTEVHKKVSSELPTPGPEETKPEETEAPAASSTPSGHDDQSTTTTTATEAHSATTEDDSHEFIDRNISPASVTPPADLSTAQTHALPQPEEHYPPEVMSLHAMFPDLEPMIIQSVFESVNGNQERAADVLLGMSDPEYVSQETERPAAPSQTDLDEEFARRLVMEEQQRQSDWENQLGYQPRRQNRSQWSGGGNNEGNAGGKDTLSELSGQFNKFAETSSVQLGKFAESSKKTLSSLMTKVKAKVQEFDNNRNNQGTAGSSQGQDWGSGTVGGGQAEQQPQYYQPPSTQPPSGGEYNQMVGYDTNPSSMTSVPSAPSPLHNYPAPRRVPVPSSDTPSGDSEAQVVADESSSGAPKPPSTSPGPPAGSIDRAKLGMLPKRPVSLSQVPQPATNRHDEDEDELDYVENPFEEGRH